MNKEVQEYPKAQIKAAIEAMHCQKRRVSESSIKYALFNNLKALTFGKPKKGSMMIKYSYIDADADDPAQEHLGTEALSDLLDFII